VSEKLDGVRCFWTGTRMYSRQGNQFFPPKWFVKGWPKSQMDGELFIGRDMFK
jgi:DNA ligase-1